MNAVLVTSYRRFPQSRRVCVRPFHLCTTNENRVNRAWLARPDRKSGSWDAYTSIVATTIQGRGDLCGVARLVGQRFARIMLCRVYNCTQSIPLYYVEYTCMLGVGAIRHPALLGMALILL